MRLYTDLLAALKDRENVQGLKIRVKGGVFPPELFNFPYLRELYLEGECHALPSRLEGWEKLRILSFRCPFFRGDLSSLFSLPSLENLKIMGTPMRRFLLPLGQVVAPLKALTIKACGLESIPEEVSMLTHLYELSLPRNSLSNLPLSFPDLRHLKRLNLDANAFTKLPDLIKQMRHLSHLSFDGNPFSEEERARIQREFQIWVN